MPGPGTISPTVSYRYDANGNRTAVTYPGNWTVESDYNGAGRLRQIRDPDGRITTFDHDPDGAIRHVNQVNGTWTDVTRDNARRLTNLHNADGAGAIAGFDYQLDVVGRRTGLGETLRRSGQPAESRGTSYSYDTLGRLTAEVAPEGTISYTHDNLGNRTESRRDGISTYSLFDSADRIWSTHQQATAGNPAAEPKANQRLYRLNLNGDTRGRGADPTGCGADEASTAPLLIGTDCFGYDRAHRPIGATINGSSFSYSYNGDGTRRSSTTNGVTRWYVPDVSGKLPVVLDDGERRYVWGPGGKLAYSVSKTLVNDVWVYHRDGLGSVRAVTDNNRTLIERKRTDAYGVRQVAEGIIRQEYGFTGEAEDAGTDLVFLRARYYDPSLGRFLSRDTVDTGGNRFAYAAGNPVSFTDPSGHWEEWVDVLGSIDAAIIGCESADGRCDSEEESSPAEPRLDRILNNPRCGKDGGPCVGGPPIGGGGGGGGRAPGNGGGGTGSRSVLPPRVVAIRQDPEVIATRARIQSNGPFPRQRDGNIWNNDKTPLPKRPSGYYREYMVTTPGVRGEGKRRIVTGQNGELYYTEDHYQTFIRIDDAAYPEPW